MAQTIEDSKKIHLIVKNCALQLCFSDDAGFQNC